MQQEDLIKEISKFKGQWFVINCNVGHEDRVRQDLLQKIESNNLGNIIFDARISKVPMENKSGKVTVKNKFPGYIFINMLMTDEAWFTVRNTPGVTGFIGSSGKGAKPFPITLEEVVKMLNDDKNVPSVEEVQQQVNDRIKSVFNIGDTVVIKEGILAEKEGKIVELNDASQSAIVNIEMFGRYVPSEVPYKNIELAYKD